MVNLDYDDVKGYLESRFLNSKNNNAIIYDLNASLRDSILKDGYNSKMMINNFDFIKGEYLAPRDAYLSNVIINLQKIPVEEILVLALKVLEISDDNILLDDWKNILKFRNMLAKYGKGIQFIFYNPNFVSEKDQELINDLFVLSDYIYNCNFLLLEGENIKSYRYHNGKVLDDREDFMKIKVLK